jgi:hypothetical protein
MRPAQQAVGQAVRGGEFTEAGAESVTKALKRYLGTLGQRPNWKRKTDLDRMQYDLPPFPKLQVQGDVIVRRRGNIKDPIELKRYVGDKRMWKLPFMTAENVAMSGARGTGVGSKLHQAINHFWQHAGYQAAGLKPGAGAHRLWSRPQFGYTHVWHRPTRQLYRITPEMRNKLMNLPAERNLSGEGLYFIRHFNPRKARRHEVAGMPRGL